MRLDGALERGGWSGETGCDLQRVAGLWELCGRHREIGLVDGENAGQVGSGDFLFSARRTVWRLEGVGKRFGEDWFRRLDAAAQMYPSRGRLGRGKRWTDSYVDCVVSPKFGCSRFKGTKGAR